MIVLSHWYFTDISRASLLSSSLCLIHHRQDKTVLSCLVGGVNRIGDKSRLVLVVLSAFRDWTKQFRDFLSPTVLTCLQFCSHHRPTRKRQDKRVCECRRWKLGFTASSHSVCQSVRRNSSARYDSMLRSVGSN